MKEEVISEGFNKKMKKILLIIISLFLSTNVFAEEKIITDKDIYSKIMEQNSQYINEYYKMGVGFGWPYCSILWNFKPNLGIEIRAITAFDDVEMLGGRINYLLHPKLRSYFWFSGIEYYLIRFDSRLNNDETGIRGGGSLIGVFIGGEYLFAQKEKLAINIDVGPTYIVLEDHYENYSVQGIEWVMNIGLKKYFF